MLPTTYVINIAEIFVLAEENLRLFRLFSGKDTTKMSHTFTISISHFQYEICQPPSPSHLHMTLLSIKTFVKRKFVLMPDNVQNLQQKTQILEVELVKVF